MRRGEVLQGCLGLALALTHVPPAVAEPPAPLPEAGQAAAPPVATVPGSGNLNINPKRVTFDRLGRSATVYVINQGGAPTTFDVQLVDRIMLPSGQIVPLADASAKPDQKQIADRLTSARDMLIATPRRVTLAGNGGQTIRIRASSAAELPAGEYRTHLTVTALPPPSAGLTAEQAAAPREGQLSFRVDSVLGLSIPVIIRIGAVDVRAAIEGARIGVGEAGREAVLTFDLVRVGTNSLFGDVEVRGARERGDRAPLGIAHGIGVYPEIGRRAVALTLRRTPARGEQIDIVFRDDDTTPGKQLAKATIAAP